MSDPAAWSEPLDALQTEPGGLPPEVDKALALCVDAARSFGTGEPCGDTLDALEALLPTLKPSDIDILMDHPDYLAVRSKLIRACAETWFERECELAHRALTDSSSLSLQALFDDHISRDAYADELAVLNAIEPRNILIIGSGACPMSAIVVQDAFPAATVVGMDRSARACDLSARLLAACGLGSIGILNGDAADPPDVERYDCILVALTVGIDETEKRQIIGALRRAADPEATLVVRTAAGWGRVLYPASDLPVIAAKANLPRSLSPLQRSVAVAVRVSELPD